jgi:hypothetical protein
MDSLQAVCVHDGLLKVMAISFQCIEKYMGGRTVEIAPQVHVKISVTPLKTNGEIGCHLQTPFYFVKDKRPNPIRRRYLKKSFSTQVWSIRMGAGSTT